jgi:hypothetical protein
MEERHSTKRQRVVKEITNSHFLVAESIAASRNAQVANNNMRNLPQEAVKSSSTVSSSITTLVANSRQKMYRDSSYLYKRESRKQYLIRPIILSAARTTKSKSDSESSSCTSSVLSSSKTSKKYGERAMENFEQDGKTQVLQSILNRLRQKPQKPYTKMSIKRRFNISPSYSVVNPRKTFKGSKVREGISGNKCEN